MFLCIDFVRVTNYFYDYDYDYVCSGHHHGDFYQISSSLFLDHGH